MIATDANSSTAPARLPWRIGVAYGFATLGTGSFIVVPQLFLLFFMTDQLGISPAWASLTLLLPKLWEFLTDPYIGLRSDRANTRWGRRHPFMFVGALSLSLGIAMMFNVPQLETWEARWLYITIMFILATTGYAVFIVPYTALLGELTPSPQERTRIVAIRMAFLSISLLIAAIVWPEILKSLGGGRSAYAMVGWGVGGLCLVAMLVTVIGTLRAPQVRRPVAQESSLASQLRGVASDKAFLSLAAAYVLHMLAQSASSAMLAYVGKYLSPLGGNFLIISFGVSTTASIVAMAVWPVIGRWLSKRQCFITGSLIGALGYLVCTYGLVHSTPLLILGSVMCGAGFAAGQLFGFSLLPDVIDARRARRATHDDGAFTGVWVGLEKLGLALGASAAGLAIGWFGFIASTGETVSQPPMALSAMLWLYGYVPAVLMSLAVWPLMTSSLKSMEARASFSAE